MIPNFLIMKHIKILVIQFQDSCSWNITKLFFVFYVWFDSLRPSQHFSSLVRSGLPGFNQYLTEDKFLAQGHNTVPLVRLEPTTPRSQVKRSTSDPPYSSEQNCSYLIPSFLIVEQTRSVIR